MADTEQILAKLGNRAKETGDKIQQSGQKMMGWSESFVQGAQSAMGMVSAI
jgi:hypothetical protein